MNHDHEQDSGSEPADVTGIKAFDDLGRFASGLKAHQAARQIIAARVVHKSASTAEALTGEYCGTHGCDLVVSVASFIGYHTTNPSLEDLAENRFFFLLHCVGNLLDLAAGMNDEPVKEVLAATLHSFASEYEDAEPDVKEVIRAAETCLVSHTLIRQGHTPLGIQRSLNLADMLEVNSALGLFLISVATRFTADAWPEVIALLLNDVAHILQSMAEAQGRPVEELVEAYFTDLSAQEVGCR